MISLSTVKMSKIRELAKEIVLDSLDCCIDNSGFVGCYEFDKKDKKELHRIMDEMRDRIQVMLDEEFGSDSESESESDSGSRNDLEEYLNIVEDINENIPNRIDTLIQSITNIDSSMNTAIGGSSSSMNDTEGMYVGPEIYCIHGYEDDDDLENALKAHYEQYGIHIQQYSSGNIRVWIKERPWPWNDDPTIIQDPEQVKERLIGEAVTRYFDHIDGLTKELEPDQKPDQNKSQDPDSGTDPKA
jgi:hypothetical protein